ncbi:gamma-glutamylcyclotransferase family protein [Pseudoalteromonas haloplanktis]|uniref:Gamma-glutamylcyclotransferase family protein n=1 Tax=Pseudoalteromonas haloplanktis TaxID=228 RepID=A0ABU1BD72_PSEHA|nr:gamma-glutamylcyclotransferase family protein [Pseudoalteromonas haloplanktis]MDQ9091899.1 gamma-glutamylcyclotransferase family protein [Pseudoalteromonas haloplanktis]
MAVYNFSFGSNMSSSRLLARLPNATRIGTATLAGYELTFDMLSCDGSGKGNIRPVDDDNAQVYGVVYQLNDAEKEILDAIEGPRYDCVDIQVTLLDGEKIAAHCYIANTTDANTLPYDWYMQHVYRGALEAGVPNAYSEAIKSRPMCQDSDTLRAAIEFAVHKNKNEN